MKHLLTTLLPLLIAACTHGSTIKLEVFNPSSVLRSSEVVETDYRTIAARLNIKENENMVVIDPNGRQTPSQITHDHKLLFLATVDAGEKVVYTVKQGQPQATKPLAYGRFIAERKDDYAWENNMVAFRLYGPALKPIDGPSNGVDVWSKRTDELIIDKWYKLNSEKQDYHTDRGEGQDCYKVGRTLGAGMTAPILNDTLVLGENFVHWKQLDNGPLRTTVCLTYAPLTVGNQSVVETRKISLDANTPFSQATVLYNGASLPLTVAAGITLHANEGSKEILPNKGAVLYWEKQEKEYGFIGTAVVIPQSLYVEAKELNNHLCAIASIKPGEELIYYFGAGYNKFRHPSLDQWRKAVAHQWIKVNCPITVTHIP